MVPVINMRYDLLLTQGEINAYMNDYLQFIKVDSRRIRVKF